MAGELLFQAGSVGTIVPTLERLGFFQYLFPFLLALAIIYGVLRMVAKDILPKSAAAVISVILAFFVMLYASFTPGIANFFANLSGFTLAAATGFLFLIVLAGLLGFKTDIFSGGGKSKWAFILVVIFIVFIIFMGAGGGSVIGLPGFVFSSDFVAVLFFIIVLALVLFVIGSEEAAPAAGGGGGRRE